MMYKYLSPFLFLAFLISIIPFPGSAQDIRINELMSSNVDVIYDEDGDTPDWIELNNFGSTPWDLSQYFLSDDPDDLQKWQLPDTDLPAGQQFVVLASGKDISQLPLYWYSLIDKGDAWKYLLPGSNVPGDWNTLAFNDNAWNEGGSSIGYGDNDDDTGIPGGTISVFMRKKFTIDELDALEALWLHMDYDDAFVAYINGVEVARSNIGVAGIPVPYDQTADFDHESVIYTGQLADPFDLSGLTGLLQLGENVLAVQVHNVSSFSSDLTAIPILTLGYSDPASFNAPLSPYVSLSSYFPHTNFKLSSSGETVYLSHSTGGIVDSVVYGAIPAKYSYGRLFNNPDSLVYFQEPTPGLPNGGLAFAEAVQSEVVFSIPNTFLFSTQELELSGAGPGEFIRYTLDSEEPDQNSPIYVQPINITETTVVRARIFKTGAIPGKMASRTYIFSADHDLPVVSVTTAPDNLWDEETGIYVLGNDYDPNFPFFGANFWEDWERPAHIEMTSENGELAFSQNCGIKIFGGWSRGNDQKSLAVFFRNIYGERTLEYPLFDSKEVSSFRSLVLRNSGNDWNWSMMRDGMMTSLVEGMDIDLQAYRPAVLYLNGEYWGIHNIREKINEDFLEGNHGADPNKIDLLEGNAYVVEGSNQHYLEFLNFLDNNDMANEANYEEVKSRIDINNFIDYELANIYFNNQDWPGNNIKFWKPQTPGSKWRWLMYDTDFGFGIWNGNAYTANTLAFAMESNGPGWPNPPWSTYVLRRLVTNTSFRHAFINRFADMLNTSFQADRVTIHIDTLADAIENEMTAHLDRWPTTTTWAWNQEINVMKNFANQRVPFVRNHIQAEFSLPAQHTINLQIVSPNTGTVDLNTITITESNWSGVYFEEVPIKLRAVPNPGYAFQKWEIDGVELTDVEIELELTESTDIAAYFIEGSGDNFSIIFNEINYNSPAGNDAGDWVELFNKGNISLDLSAWLFKDSDDAHEFVLPQGTILAPGSFLILCEDESKFTSTHPDVPNYLGEFDFGLSTDGDAIRLYDASGLLIDSVFYGVEAPWPPAANGQGPSLELIHPDLDNVLPESWTASAVEGGTPGEENSGLVNTSGPGKASGLDHSLTIFPNPFADHTNIRFTKPITDPYSIRIYDTSGKIVFQAADLSREIFQWNGKNDGGTLLANGFYICKVRTNEGLCSKKIVIAR